MPAGLSLTLGERALDLALAEIEMWPFPERERRRLRELESWAKREFQTGRPQEWLTHRFDPGLWARVVSHELMVAARLLERETMLHRPLPAYRTMRWDELLAWVTARLRDEDEWDERAVVYAFGDGWTVEFVRTGDDLDREGRLMKHCLNVETGRTHTAVLSLRSPVGKPHATIVVGFRGHDAEGAAGELYEVVGRCDLPLKVAYAARVAEFCRAAGLEWELGDEDDAEWRDAVYRRLQGDAAWAAMSRR